jgi:hypothetical protein
MKLDNHWRFGDSQSKILDNFMLSFLGLDTEDACGGTLMKAFCTLITDSAYLDSHKGG